MNSGRACSVFVEQFCQTKIQHLDLAGRRDHHIAGFDVAMNDAASVCGSECLCCLQRDGQSTFERQRAAVYELPHILPFNELHRDEMDAVDLIEIKNGADVWMVKGRSEARFTLETPEVCFACGELGREDFDDEGAAQFRVDRFINRTLAALTELLENLIVAQRGADHLNRTGPQITHIESM